MRLQLQLPSTAQRVVIHTAPDRERAKGKYLGRRLLFDWPAPLYLVPITWFSSCLSSSCRNCSVPTPPTANHFTHHTISAHPDSTNLLNLFLSPFRLLLSEPTLIFSSKIHFSEDLALFEIPSDYTTGQTRPVCVAQPIYRLRQRSCKDTKLTTCLHLHHQKH